MTRSLDSAGQPPPETGRLKRILTGALRVGISALLVGLIVWKVGAQELMDRLAKIDALSVILSVCLLAVAALHHAWRWKRVLRQFGYGWRSAAAVRELWVGYFFNQILPTSAGGDGVRVFRLVRANVPFGAAFLSVVVERLFALAACVICGIPAVVFLIYRAPSHPVTIAISVLEAAAALALLFMLASPSWFKKLLPKRFEPQYQRVVGALLDPHAGLGNLGISVVMQVVTALSIIGLAIGTKIPVSPFELFLLVPPVILLAMMPISFAGWGLREGAMVGVLAALGVAAADALLLSLLFGTVNLILGLPGALGLIIRSKAAGPYKIEDARLVT
jgi:glycosyltransferase 2 family protein